MCLSLDHTPSSLSLSQPHHARTRPTRAMHSCASHASILQFPRCITSHCMSACLTRSRSDIARTAPRTDGRTDAWLFVFMLSALHDSSTAKTADNFRTRPIFRRRASRASRISLVQMTRRWDGRSGKSGTVGTMGIMRPRKVGREPPRGIRCSRAHKAKTASKASNVGPMA